MYWHHNIAPGETPVYLDRQSQRWGVGLKKAQLSGGQSRPEMWMEVRNRNQSRPPVVRKPRVHIRFYEGYYNYGRIGQECLLEYNPGINYAIKGEGVGVGSSLPETAAGTGILAGFTGIFGVFKTSSKCGFGLHSFGVCT